MATLVVEYLCSLGGCVVLFFAQNFRLSDTFLTRFVKLNKKNDKFRCVFIMSNK